MSSRRRCLIKLYWQKKLSSSSCYENCNVAKLRNPNNNTTLHVHLLPDTDSERSCIVLKLRIENGVWILRPIVTARSGNLLLPGYKSTYLAIGARSRLNALFGVTDPTGGQITEHDHLKTVRVLTYQSCKDYSKLKIE